MELLRIEQQDLLVVQVEGRIDGYWADHLDAALREAVSHGHHRLAIDCSKVTFLSSAGIGILAKHYKELTGISGSFQVVNPSKPVDTVLRLTRLASLLISSAGSSPAVAVTPVRKGQRVEADDLALDIFELDAKARLTCRPLGSAAPLAAGQFRDADSVSLGGSEPALVIGVGAFGGSFAECRRRFGELLSVGGATVYQPADGTDVPDYLVAKGPLAADIRMLYGLACDGRFSHLIRFEALESNAVVSLSRLAAACLRQSNADAIGMVVLAETAGLVGVRLTQSPTERTDGDGFFSHPGIRTRVTFTAERAYIHSVSLTVGIATTRAEFPGSDQLRPMGRGLSGHLHAAAFRFRPLQQGYIEPAATIERLFDGDRPEGVLHLVNDDRRAVGAGESEFIRGACWVAPVV